MATPKIDRIAIEFIQRIGGTFDSAFTPGSGTMPASDLIDDANTIMTFINKAMFKLFNDVWMSANGDVEVFTRIFPELIQRDSVTFTSSEYTIVNPSMHIFKLINGYNTAGVYFKSWSPVKYAVAKTGYETQYVGTDAKPALMHMSDVGKIFLFSDNNITPITLVYIKFPLNKTDGSFLTQNGSYDSPFYDQWNTRIAEIAEAMYSQAVARTS